MLTSATTVVERRSVLTSDVGTHPYEAGWASEALFFVRTEGPHPALTIQAQVSPDGIDWVNRGDAVRLDVDDSLVELPIDRFGTWIRLHISGATPEQQATVLVHIALKG